MRLVPARAAPVAGALLAALAVLLRRRVAGDIGAKLITNTTLGVPYYKYSITGPKTLF